MGGEYPSRPPGLCGPPLAMLGMVRKKYLFRADLNLVDQARFDRMARLQGVMGEASASATVRRLIDEAARQHGVYDAPAAAPTVAAPAAAAPQDAQALEQLRGIIAGGSGDAAAVLRRLLRPR